VNAGGGGFESGREMSGAGYRGQPIVMVIPASPELPNATIREINEEEDEEDDIPLARIKAGVS